MLTPYTFRISAEERAIIARLAQHYERRQGDMLRFLLRQELRRLGLDLPSGGPEVVEEPAGPGDDDDLDFDPSRL